MLQYHQLRRLLKEAIESDSIEMDNRYLKFVNQRDAKTVRMMVDKAAIDAGYTIKVYHGTNERFNIFTSWTPNFFTLSRSYAKVYGKKIMTIFLNPGRIFDISSDEEAFDIYNNEFLEYQVSKQYMSHEQVELWKRTQNQSIDFAIVDDLYCFLNKYNRQHGKTFDSIRFNEGGSIIGDENADVAFVPLSNTRIKLADLETYDNNGNIIPLSKRFDINNSDIRY